MPLDLEYLIPRFDKAGVRFAEVDGNIDLGTDSGRLAARILIAVAKAEHGYGEDHVTAHPVEGPAVAEACAGVLGGGTISGIMREWTGLGLMPPQRERRGTTRWNRNSIRSILLNPRIAGLSVYHGEIVGQGTWEPVVPEETWRTVKGILEDPARKPPRGVRTLLGGIARCPCGNAAVGGHSHTGHQVYRCSMPTRACLIFCVSRGQISQCDGCCAGGEDTLSEHGRSRKGAGNRRRGHGGRGPAGNGAHR